MNTKFKFKNDRYKESRGGYSRRLLLTCEKCKNPVSLYQKDGHGILKRLYIDRMIARKNPASKNLECKKCKTILGVKILYQKENRPAYRLFAGAVEKKLIKTNKALRMDILAEMDGK